MRKMHIVLFTRDSIFSKNRLLLAECLDSKEGMRQLLAELDSEGRETHAAIAFIATVIKEHGAVPASIDLYRQAPLA